MQIKRAWDDPEQVFSEYRTGIQYKSGIGEKGLYCQSEINRRFFEGDQWHGARCGGERPLVRHNIIRRIGEYKMAAVGGAPVAVNFSADGVADTVKLRDITYRNRQAAATGELPPLAPDEEVALVTDALSKYFSFTAERIGFEELRGQVLNAAYCTGTGILYTYWDEYIRTGQYADERRTAPITGDIACELLDVENVYFGDPTVIDIQKQPFIVIAQRRTVEQLRSLAKRYGCRREDIAAIHPDRDEYVPAGEPEGEQKATLLTKFYKQYDEKGNTHVYGVQVCRGVTVRPAWDMGVRLYPLCAFRWDTLPDCVYGSSEVTYLIPNQIAINRMLTASVWAMMMQGLPTLLVNGDVIQQPVTNDPGQVIRVFGSGDDVRSAMTYVDPPQFSAALTAEIEGLIQNTLTQSGANAVTLGDVTPNNTSAIIAVREAAMLPLQTVQARFNAFCEQVARVWAEFWVTGYGKRAIAVRDELGTWYLPFDGERYRDLILRARVDVGAASLWSESQSIITLDNLFDRGVITAEQYLKRLPSGVVPDVDGLLRDMGGMTDDGTGSV